MRRRLKRDEAESSLLSTFDISFFISGRKVNTPVHYSLAHLLLLVAPGFLPISQRIFELRVSQL